MKNQKQEKDWGEIAEQYDEAAKYVVGENICKEISKKLSTEKNLGQVIEFGCGTGYFTKAIAKNSECTIATDISEEMLKMAKKRLKNYKNVNFQKTDCKKTNFPDNKFDTVLMVNLLHVIKEQHKVLEESYRILKNDGLLIIIDLTGYGMKKLEMLKMVIKYIRKMGKPPKTDRGNLSPSDLDYLVKNAGFKIKENILLGNKVKAIYFKNAKT